MENNFRSGFAALIGRPNVGKSTLMNHAVGQKIAITSRKPQTTRNRIMAVYTGKEGQIIFLDTPGIHKPKNKLGRYMSHATRSAVEDVDVILWLIEPSPKIGPGDTMIAEQLRDARTPVILVINKTDTCDKETVAETIKAFSAMQKFDAVVPVSALRGTNIDELLRTILQCLPYGPKYYDDEVVTDQPERQIVAELIREKALRCLSEEVPHGIAVTIERMHERPDGNIVDIDATIICERDSHKRIIIGKGGSMIKRIGTQARRDIEKMLGQQVNLKLWVKVRKDWRDSDVMMKNFGYNEKEI